MTLSQLVLRSMQKNIKHYYLYFFALIFSVTLYFSFITLQFNDSVLKATEKSGTATAGFEAASYLLYFIVTFFVLYANHLFMKRRSKEIGLYQLIGMTKGLIVRLIALENMLLFVGAVVIGMGAGFLSSRIFAMILLKVLDYDTVVSMTFSTEAIVRTALIFGVLLLVILIQMAFIIRRVSLLSLFTASKQADERVKRFSPVQMIVGAIGIGLIVYGYYASTKLFDLESASNLFLNMIIILVTTIGGTFLVFRFSVSFVMNLIRLKKNGHLSSVDVLAVTPIMHRMKGNAKSLTLITVLTAVSLAITTLSYITYYSAASQARVTSPTDFTVFDEEGEKFLAALEMNDIPYETTTYRLKQVKVNVSEIVDVNLKNSPLINLDAETTVIPLSDFQQIVPEYTTLSEGEVLVTNHVGTLAQMLPIKVDSVPTVQADEQLFEMRITEVREDLLGGSAIGGGAPIFIVTDMQFAALPTVATMPFAKQISVEVTEEYEERAESLYQAMNMNNLSKEVHDESGEKVVETIYQPSFEQARSGTIKSMGVVIFTTAFLGLAFLLATGSILYFKQMSEADEELPSYTILRKIGFSQQDIMRGIYKKQAFNFGVPLFIGLLHSYFAVKSGWFLFGSELVAPLLITMSLYIAMYMLFAVLSISYYKKVIKQSL
ncbi:FtsX-like permease family protein [Lysinibacillus sp. LZ02]|uniref:FtsX-like permease family protein n=1 Tax=Lysinibacillus sp. LZ02 TaxID=3420668 RepID=UPI003D36DE90